MKIKDQIREAMLARNMSVQDLAKAVGVSNQSVRMWLKGATGPRARLVSNVQCALGIRIDFSEEESSETASSADLLLAQYPELWAFARMRGDVRDSLRSLILTLDQSSNKPAAVLAGTLATYAMSAPQRTDGAHRSQHGAGIQETP